jgi:hypothetical protein
MSQWKVNGALKKSPLKEYGVSKGEGRLELPPTFSVKVLKSIPSPYVQNMENLILLDSKSSS